MKAQAQTRLLLALWDLGGSKQEVKKGELTKRIVTKGKKVSDFLSIFDTLEKQGAIAISKQGYSMVSPKGIEVLGEGLKSDDFRFEGTIVGTWTANALLKWIHQTNGAVSIAPANGVKGAMPSAGGAIASYDEFKQVALTVFDRLNQDYNHNNLVPIYQIRREIGDRTSRENFANWLREMQVEDIFLLQGGEMLDITSDKAEDSISTSLGELRYYATRLSS